MVGRVFLAGEAGSCMNTNGRQSLERIGKIASFVLAWGIVAWQLWRTQYGEEPHWMFMGLAAAILAPAALDLVMSRGGSIASSGSPPSSPSPSSSDSPSDSPSGGG